MDTININGRTYLVGFDPAGGKDYAAAIIIGDSGCKHGRGFKYVHQLQNFYYVLNGTELPINL